MTTNITNSKYKGVIFDLDGTLVNSLDDLADSMNSVLRDSGLPEHPVDAYRIFVGNGMRNLALRALPDSHKDTVDSMLDSLVTVYEANALNKTAPYPGIDLLINTLKEQGIPMCIVTNKKDSLTTNIVDAFFKDCFVCVVGDRFDGYRKPHAKYPLECASMMGLDPKDVLFIGDSDVDIQTAINSGMDSCGVLWGFRSETELREAGAIHVTNDPAYIATLFEDTHSAN